MEPEVQNPKQRVRAGKTEARVSKSQKPGEPEKKQCKLRCERDLFVELVRCF